MMIILMCLSCFLGCGSSSSLVGGHLKLKEETQLQNLETEGQINKRWFFLPSLSTASLVGKLKPAANHLKSILTKIFLSQPKKKKKKKNTVYPTSQKKKTTTVYPPTLEAKTVLIMGFTALIGLLGASNRINHHGSIVPTALFHEPTITFTFFLIVIMTIIYFAAIGRILEKACPRIAKVLNVISFVYIVLGVTVLLLPESQKP